MGPAPLRRAGKTKVMAGSRADDLPIVIDMEVTLSAVAGKLAFA